MISILSIYFLETSAACGLFVSFFFPRIPLARRSAGLLQLCVSTTSTGLFFCRYTRITACNIPAPDRQAETLGGINKHAKANALFARQAKIPLPVASCHCYFVYCYFLFSNFLVLARVSIPYTIPYPRVHCVRVSATPPRRNNRISQGNKFNYWTDSIAPKADWPFWKQILFAATAW